MRSALKYTTQRYKSLAGFAIYACRVRYIFDAICPLGRERYLYHIATDRKGGYIAFERKRKYIAFATANISPDKLASVDTDAVIAKKSGRGDFTTLRPFSIGRYVFC